MTDPSSVSEIAEPLPTPNPDRTRKVLIAVIVTILVVLGLKLLVARWMRHGGPRRAISGIAEDGAVKLVDALLDEVLPAA
jgi:hypothetical protein